MEMRRLPPTAMPATPTSQPLMTSPRPRLKSMRPLSNSFLFLASQPRYWTVTRPFRATGPSPVAKSSTTTPPESVFLARLAEAGVFAGVLASSLAGVLAGVLASFLAGVLASCLAGSLRAFLAGCVAAGAARFLPLAGISSSSSSSSALTSMMPTISASTASAIRNVAQATPNALFPDAAAALLGFGALSQAVMTAAPSAGTRKTRKSSEPAAAPARKRTRTSPAATTDTEDPAAEKDFKLTSDDKKQLNKLAADKYRRKKKQQFDTLVKDNEDLRRELDRLSAQNAKLEEELEFLRSVVADGKAQPAVPAPGPATAQTDLARIEQKLDCLMAALKPQGQ
eukprot:m.74064 g.74064  ORF g.74064 m.74064 type:complete len:340 (+) comp8044_c0_seq2:271-1290(+)